MATQTLDKKTFKPVETVRTARRAYLGLFGMAYDRANMRLNQVRKLSEVTFEDCIERGGKIQSKVVDVAGEFKTDTQSKAGTTLESVRDTLTKSTVSVANVMPKTIRFKGAQISKLEAEVEALTAKLNRVSKAQMETVAKKAKKTKSKAAPKPIVQVAAKTPETLHVETVQAETIQVETTPVSTLAKAPTTDMAVSPTAMVTATTSELPESAITYIADVRGYDANADVEIIRKIVNHCGIALKSRDGKFVACSDEAERQTVRESWLVKKLGVSGETAELDAKVMAVCETMQKDRMKNRVTFYYLIAKNEGLLNTL